LGFRNVVAIGAALLLAAGGALSLRHVTVDLLQRSIAAPFGGELRMLAKNIIEIQVIALTPSKAAGQNALANRVKVRRLL
jgi:hypothetical protein